MELFLEVGKWCTYFVLFMAILMGIGGLASVFFDWVSGPSEDTLGELMMRQHQEAVKHKLAEKAEKATNLRVGDMVRAITPDGEVLVGLMQNLMRDGKDNYFVLLGRTSEYGKEEYWFNMDNVEKVDQC